MPNGTHKPPSLIHSPLSSKGGKHARSNSLCNLHIGSLLHFGLLRIKEYGAKQRREEQTKKKMK
jgi:hypothetical protein